METEARRVGLENNANHYSPSCDEPVVCGIVLAGGEGTRLRPFIRALGKKTLPKQYVNFIGRRSMLEHTLDRVEKLMPRQRVLTVVNQNHFDYPEVADQLRKRPEQTVLVQPQNKETGIGLLFALAHLQRRYPSSVALVLPSDHFVAEEDRLVNHAHLAINLARRDPAKLILLGIHPDTDEPEYGYILPGKKILGGAPEAAELSWFIEKPDSETARRLRQAGALWNTMIMALQPRTLLHWISRVAPDAYGSFLRIRDAIGLPNEAKLMREIYQRLKPVNFSKQLLEPMVARYPSSLITFPVHNVLWSDWGTADRIMATLRRTGNLSRLNGKRRGFPKRQQQGEQLPTAPV